MDELTVLEARLALEKKRRRQLAQELSGVKSQLQRLTLEMAETEQRERRRIADLLHDDLQQLLVGARFQLQTFSRHHSDSPKLEEILNLLDRSIATTRHLSQQCRSTAAHPTGPVDSDKRGIQNGHERQVTRSDAFGEDGSKKIRVLLADDHQVMRQGMRNIVAGHPRIQVVGEAENGRKALEMTRRLRPDVVVMDLNMPEMDGLKATGRIKAELPEVRVIGLSMYEEEEIAMAKAMRLVGAEAYVNKSASPDELLKVIEAVGGFPVKGEGRF